MIIRQMVAVLIAGCALNIAVAASPPKAANVDAKRPAHADKEAGQWMMYGGTYSE